MMPTRNDYVDVRNNIVGKTQNLRLFDVYVIGPALAYTAYKCDNLSPFFRLFLASVGIGTSAYNFRNYQLQQAIIDGQNTHTRG